MGNKEEEEIKRLREAATKVKINRTPKRFDVPRMLKTPILWTLFFIIVGIVQKSIIEGRVVFVDFLYKYYIEWFSSFGNFYENYVVSGYDEILSLILNSWYYFFITGGLISLIWAILHLLFNINRSVKRDEVSLYIDNKLSKV